MIEINEPYNMAGLKFGWNGDPKGLGLATHLFNGGGILEVKLKSTGKVYRIDKKKAIDLVTKYKSIYSAKSMRLGVVPLSEFEVVNEGIFADEKLGLEDMI